MKTSLRQNVIDYIRKTYQAEIEYLWMRYPEYGIFRHKDNQKWYALMMDVPRAKLGLKGDKIIDVLKNNACFTCYWCYCLYNNSNTVYDSCRLYEL